MEERLYRPSLFDRFNNWIDRLPLRAWISYFVFGTVLVLIQMLFLWLEGGSQATVLLPVIIFNGIAVPALLGMIYLFDNQAVTALHSMRSILNFSEDEFYSYEFRLSNMPNIQSLAAGLVFLFVMIIMELLWSTPVRYAILEQLPVFNVVYHIIDKSSAFLYGVFFYHTIRQLRLVISINATPIHLNLFNPGPLQAFSRLTASTAIGLVVGMYGWMLINPDLLANRVAFGFVLLVTILAVLVFVWPLWGVHKLMEKEKVKAVHEINHRSDVVFSKFNQHIDDDDITAAERLTGVIASQEIQHKRISAIPTWPWKSETARLVLTAIALPVMLMILQYFVLQALNR